MKMHLLLLFNLIILNLNSYGIKMSEISLQDVLKIMPNQNIDVIELEQNVIKKAKDDIDDLIQSNYNSKDVLYRLDDIFLDYEKTIYRWELFSQVTCDDDLRNKISKSYVVLQSMHNELFLTNKALYQFLKRVYENDNFGLKDFEKYAYQNLFESFKHAGFDLEKSDYDRLIILRNQYCELDVQFQKNIASETKSIEVLKDQVKSLCDETKKTLQITKSGNYLIPIDSSTVTAILKECDNEDVRKLVYQAYENRGYPSNKKVLGDIINIRDEIAQILGFESFADFDLENQMVKSVENAWNFENRLIKSIVPFAKKEIEVLKSNLPFSISLTFEGQIKPWDLAFIMDKYSKSKFSVDEKELSQYFPFDHTLNKMFELYGLFFNLDFKKCEVSGLWHETVSLYQVNDKNSDTVRGYIFIDPYPRKDKYTHAAMFDLLPSFAKDNKISPSICALVMNFQKPTENTPSLLYYSDVKTLFHECGHGLHAILGTTELKMQSGTRVKRDFVELPSQLLEYWLENKEILKMVGSHFKTGKSIPDSLIDAKLKQLNFGQAIFTSRQISLGTFSLRCHAKGKDKNFDELLKFSKYEVLPEILHDESSHMYCSFGHVAGSYSAKYYCYLWTKVFAADLFDQIKKEGMLNPDAGKKYIENVLKLAASADPSDLLFNYLQRQPNEDRFFLYFN